VPYLNRPGRGGEGTPTATAGRGRGGASGGASSFRTIGYGAYKVVGRMGDLPLQLDVPPPSPALPRPPDSSILSRLAPESSAIGSYDPDPEHNGGRPLESIHLTRDQLDKLCSEGASLIEAAVKGAD